EVLSRFPGAQTAKVKVAEPGQTLDEDVARVEAVRARIRTVRVDANGGWTVAQAVHALTALTRDGALEYAEQPCATVEELAELRRRLPGVPIAADESIRRASDPLRVAQARAADIAVLKVAPLGGVHALLEIAARIGMPAVISSALDSAVGIGIGLRAAAALPELDHACGLGTGGFFLADVADVPPVVDGHLPVTSCTPDPARLAALAVPADRLDRWRRRVADCHALLNR
ncbi:o-succinylbenzoate synthase, partial [Mycobacteroides abscessus]